MDIICSIGPTVKTMEDIEEYISSGMTIPRFNFSHVDYEKFNDLMLGIKKSHKDISILQDLQGNKIRVSKLFNKEIKVYKGDKIIFCLEKDYYKLKFNKKYIIVPISYEGTLKDFKNVNLLYMKDATMKFEIKSKGPIYIYAITERGGIIRNEKGINAPLLDRSNLTLTRKDKDDILWALKRGVNMICLSFVTSARDIIELRDYIKGLKKTLNIKTPIKIIAKIECIEGYNNFEEILKTSDAIMLGRGDLKGECDYTSIPIMQENLIKRMKKSKKPLYIATYILDSMKRGNIASLAEINDIYNFVKEGVNGIMLSTEITISRNPEYIIGFLDTCIDKYSKSLNKEQ